MNKKKKRFTRFTALSIIVLIVTSAICARLVYLQVIEAQVYDAKANTKAHKFIKEDAARGNITDSTGKVLATTQQSYNVTYLETDLTKKFFYNTMAKVFYMLDKNDETQKDEFPIKINGNTYSFDFNTSDPKEISIDTAKFLEYRGFKDNVMKNLSIDKKWKELTKAEQKKVNDYLLKISPKYVFEKLRVRYKIPSSYTINVDGKTISKKCTLEDIRKFMVARDAVEMKSYSGYQAVDISSNIKRETAIAFMQRLNDLPGVDVKQEPIRSYPFGKLASNVLGYVGKIATSGPDESEAYAERGYDVSSDLIGMSGLEAAEEDRLKGTAGGRVVEVNKSGRVINEFASKEPYPGQNIKTTINADVQYAAEQALNSSLEWLRKNPKGPHDSYTGNATRGAAVAIDVNTGAVIALASYPNFDPNDFSNPNGLSDEAMKKYFPSVEDQMKNLKLTDEQKEFMFPIDKSTGKRIDGYDYLAKPLYNYALLGLTPPGSTFKPLTAIAGLETGAITPDVQVDDEGVFEDNGKVIATFDADGKLGSLNLIGAIAHSSNAYFMSVGRWLRQKCGEDILAQYAWKFGLGVKPNSGISPSTGIEIKENFGQVFNSYSIKNNFGQQAAWKIMKDLLDEAYIKNTAIDLYTSDSDSKDIVKLKASIKDTIKASVVAGKFDKDKFSQLLNEFMENSPAYKGVTLPTSDMNSILKDVNSVVVSYIGQAAAPGAMYSASIGQGNDNFTILQIANYIATIANGGKRYKVHLVDQITDPTDGSVVYKTNPEVVKDTKVSQATLNTVKEGMKQVNTIGTAAGKFTDFPFATAGKTGTADPYSSNEFEKKIGRTSYALYVGFAPADNPKIAVATILYDGGFGGQSTDVARAIYEAYFNKVEKTPDFPKEFQITAQKEVDNP